MTEQLPERYASASYDFWFERLGREGRLGRLLQRLPHALRRPLAAIVVASVPVIVGVIAAAATGHLGLYLRTRAIWVGLVAVAWVVFIATVGVERLGVSLAGLEDIVPTSNQAKEKYREHVEGSLKGAASRKSASLISVALAGAGGLLLALALHGWSRTARGSFAFPAGWHTRDSRTLAAPVIGFDILWCAIVMGAAVDLLGRNLLFVWRLRRLSVVAFPALVRARLQPLVHTYLFVSATWSIGVGLFVLVLVGHYTAITIAFLTALFLLGLATFGAPYGVARAILDRSHADMSEQLVQRLTPRSRQPHFGRLDVGTFISVSNAIVADAPPVLGRRGTMAYLTTQTVVIASLIEKAAIQSLLHISL